MSKICSESVPIPIKIVFEESLKKNKITRDKKKANVVSAHQKEDLTGGLLSYQQTSYFWLKINL